MGDEVEVYFCPKCKSTDVKYVFELMNLFGVIPTQECGKCHLRSNVFPILVANKDSLKKKKGKSKGAKK
jgi:hypothetical protein